MQFRRHRYEEHQYSLGFTVVFTSRATPRPISKLLTVLHLRCLSYGRAIDNRTIEFGFSHTAASLCACISELWDRGSTDPHGTHLQRLGGCVPARNHCP